MSKLLILVLTKLEKHRAFLTYIPQWVQTILWSILWVPMFLIIIVIGLFVFSN